jgi:ureidoacrylate peracid hydrolase
MKACLLVIDFINEITHDEGKAPSCAAFVKDYKVIKKTNAAIAFAREHSMLTIFVKIGFSRNYYETPSQSPVFSGAPGKEAFKLNEWGTEFHEDLDHRLTDAVIVKSRVSPFYATALEAYLRAQKIDTVIVCGVSTNNAVQAAARDAHDRDYRVIILEDACGAKNLQTHENTLVLLKDFSEVIKVEDLNMLTE